jgi:hypothetical protein
LLKIFSPEAKFGEGCDLAIVSSENNSAFLVEFKSCNLSLKDINKAAKQLRSSEDKIRQEGLAKKITKILVHDDRKGCHVTAQVSILLESENIKKVAMSSNNSAKFFYRQYRTLKKNEIL